MELVTDKLDRAARRLDLPYLESLGVPIPDDADDARLAVLETVNVHRHGDDSIPAEHLRCQWLVPTFDRGHVRVADLIPEATFAAIEWAPHISDGAIPIVGLSPALLSDLDDRELDHIDVFVFTVSALRIEADGGEWTFHRREVAERYIPDGGEPKFRGAIDALTHRGWLEHDLDGTISTLRLGERSQGAPLLEGSTAVAASRRQQDATRAAREAAFGG